MIAQTVQRRELEFGTLVATQLDLRGTVVIELGRFVGRFVNAAIITRIHLQAVDLPVSGHL